jgi:hypothetical protein
MRFADLLACSTYRGKWHGVSGGVERERSGALELPYERALKEIEARGCTRCALHAALR